jgi:hypothetical protein
VKSDAWYSHSEHVCGLRLVLAEIQCRFSHWPFSLVACTLTRRDRRRQTVRTHAFSESASPWQRPRLQRRPRHRHVTPASLARRPTTVGLSPVEAMWVSTSLRVMRGHARAPHGYAHPLHPLPPHTHHTHSFCHANPTRTHTFHSILVFFLDIAVVNAHTACTNHGHCTRDPNNTNLIFSTFSC